MSVLSIGSVNTTDDNLTPISPDPAHGGYKVGLQDIDAADAGRSADGTMIRNRVCGGSTAKRKIELTFPPLTTSQMTTILAAISDEYFKVKYFDPYTGADRVGIFYAGDRSAPMYWKLTRGNDTIVLWEELSVNFIEK